MCTTCVLHNMAVTLQLNAIIDIDCRVNMRGLLSIQHDGLDQDSSPRGSLNFLRPDFRTSATLFERSLFAAGVPLSGVVVPLLAAVVRWSDDA